jgi:DNA-binding response OmpR family regulator
MRDFDTHTPILFFSGAAYEADKKRGIEAGANAYVIKPDVDGLVGSIRQLVSDAETANAEVLRARRNVGIPPPSTFKLRELICGLEHIQTASRSLC